MARSSAARRVEPTPEAPVGSFRLAAPALVATTGFPPGGGGSATIMKHFADLFSNGSVVLALHKRTEQPPPTAHPFVYVSNALAFSSRLSRLWSRLELPLVTRRIERAAHRFGCGSIFGVFPDIHMFTAAIEASRRSRLPFDAYLHDTIVETMSPGNRRLGERAQRYVMRRARKVFVASEGMREFYQNTYELATHPIFHIYPEPIPATWPGPAPERTVVWSGNVYGINRAALRRVFDAITGLDGFRLVMATQRPRSALAQVGLAGDRLETVYFPMERRNDYLEFLTRQTIALVALSWPDEADVHEDELRTIFSTKIPEYLAAGRPILLHCPEHYFMARFFRERGCAEVVGERSVEAVRAAIARLGADVGRQRALAERGLEVARMYSVEQVAEQVRRGMSDLLAR